MVCKRHDLVEDDVAEALLVGLLLSLVVKTEVVHVLLVGHWIHDEELGANLL